MKQPEHSSSAWEIAFALLPEVVQNWIATQINNYLIYQHRRQLNQEINEDLHAAQSKRDQDV